MPDAFANITQVPPEMVDVIANVLETRAAIPSQQEMIHAYLGEIAFPMNAKVLEVGCGTGPVCRALAATPGVGKVVGIDPSDRLLAKAGELSADFDIITYQQGDGKELPFEDASFDAVILHTIFSLTCQGPKGFCPRHTVFLKKMAGSACATVISPRRHCAYRAQIRSKPAVKHSWIIS